MNRFHFLAVTAALLLGPACSSTPGETPPDAAVDQSGPDAAAPVPVTCTITSPAADALLTGTVNVTVEFEGPAKTIDLLDGANTVVSADVTTSPATLVLDTTKLSEGAHSLKAKATSVDLSGESAAVAVAVDNQAPSVTLGVERLAVLSGAQAVIPLDVTEANVAKCQLLEGDTVLVDLTEVPADLLWDTTKVAEGVHALKLSVTDKVGHTTVSPEQKVIVGNTALVPDITYIPEAKVSIPENWQTVEIDVRGMVVNPGRVRRIVTWLTWDPTVTRTPMNLEYSLGQGLCPHRGIKFTGQESTGGEIVIELERSDVTYTEAQATNYPWKADPSSFPDNDDPNTAGSFFGHIAVMDAGDHVNESLPVEMHFVLFTE